MGGETIFEHFSSQDCLYKNKLTLKHGARATKASVMLDSWILDDRHSIQRLNQLARLPGINSFIVKIQVDLKWSRYESSIFFNDITNFAKKLFNISINLETIVFGPNLSYILLKANDGYRSFAKHILKILATTTKLKYINLAYIDFNAEVHRSECKTCSRPSTPFKLLQFLREKK